MLLAALKAGLRAEVGPLGAALLLIHGAALLQHVPGGTHGAEVMPCRWQGFDGLCCVAPACLIAQYREISEPVSGPRWTGTGRLCISVYEFQMTPDSKSVVWPALSRSSQRVLLVMASLQRMAVARQGAGCAMPTTVFSPANAERSAGRCIT